MNVSGSVDSQTSSVVGTLRVADGVRRDAGPCATMSTAPPRAARGREGERLCFLLDLAGPATPHLYREMREVVVQEYWATSGSVTAAMRRAAAAANRHLFRFNLRVASPNRCYGGLTCAVLHGEDIFILHAGPGRSGVLHRGRFEAFPRDGQLPHLGMGVVADMRLYHAFAAAGDTLLLASSSIVQAAGDEGLARVLPRTDVREVLAGLEQVGAGVDFTALVARLAPPSVAPSFEAPRPVARPVPAPRSAAPALPPKEPAAREVPGTQEAPGAPGAPWQSISARVTEGLQSPRRREARPPAPPDLPPSTYEPVREPVRDTGPGLGERVVDGARVVGRELGTGAKNGARAVGRGVAAAGAALASGAKALFWRMLPGADRRAQQQKRVPRPVPKENRVVMMAIAVGIPILVALLTWFVYSTLGARAQFEGAKAQVEQAAQLALTSSVVSETRRHWEDVLAKAEAANELKAGDERIAELQAQARKAIDDIDRVVRLGFVELANFGASDVPRRIVVHRQTVFVLDPVAGWVAYVNFGLTEDGIIIGEPSVTFVNTGMEIDGGTVGDLIDLVWVEAGSGRMASGLAILEEGGGLVNYDPAWGGEGGEPLLTRSFLDTTPRDPRAISSFEGRLYVLDAGEGQGQIWRYDPQDEVYPNPAGHYFAVAPSRPLADAVDMAIDANVYILHEGGTIQKYLTGESQPFDTGGVRDGFSAPVSLAVDLEGNSDRVYVADQGHQRVVVLEADGAFLAEFRADEAYDTAGALNALEALAVDEAAGRFYAFSGGRLYVAPLPLLP
jgi:hypothetical protein